MDAVMSMSEYWDFDRGAVVALELDSFVLK